MYLYNKVRYHREKKQFSRIRNTVILTALLLMILPFHYITDSFEIVPKKQWGFSNTFVTATDINEAMISYNSADKIGKDEILDQTWVQKAMYERSASNSSQK